MNSTAQKIYRESKAVSEQLLILLRQLSGNAPSEMNPIWHADVSYSLRESEEQIESLLKEIRKCRKLVNTVGVLLCTTSMIEKVTTEYCTATPTSKIIYTYPAKRRDNYMMFDRLMLELGIPETVAQAELVRPHWPAMQEHFQQLLAEGKNVPGGVDPNKTFNEYDFSIRKKKGVLE